MGMLVAIVVTLLHREIVSPWMILVGIVIGSCIGTVLARKIKMTAMPQMVAVFNGFGGGASALVAAGEFVKQFREGVEIPGDVAVTILLGILVGTVTFTGSMIAFGKLQGIVETKPVTFPLQKTLSFVLFLGILAMGGYLLYEPNLIVFTALGSVSLLLGVLLVIPIGGADMPVVISLLNSYSGIAAAMAGFVLKNPVLIVAGALVGAAGMILTMIMCKAMNRSLANVMFGAFGATGGAAVAGGPAGDKPVHQVTVEDASIMLAYAGSAIFVPGYGMAVARAQHALKEMADLMEEKGVQVRYAIHPVAGRMPGHMNVLLAEADVPHDKLYDLDHINKDFDTTDVVVVIGANDVVNPAARDNPGSPIYGMPILNVDHAQHVIVMKRSLNPGFAGIDNELFYKDNTHMLFGDARDSLGKLSEEIKAL